LIAARPILSELDLFRADPARFGHATPLRFTHVPFNLILLNLAINARDASRRRAAWRSSPRPWEAC